MRFFNIVILIRPWCINTELLLYPFHPEKLKTLNLSRLNTPVLVCILHNLSLKRILSLKIKSLSSGDLIIAVIGAGGGVVVVVVARHSARLAPGTSRSELKVGSFSKNFIPANFIFCFREQQTTERKKKK